ncbi:MAG: peptidylprolyl isomerase [Burkholderiales bacterium]
MNSRVRLLIQMGVLTGLMHGVTVSAASNTGDILVEGAGAQVTAEDVLSEAQRMPEPARIAFFRKPQNVAEVASNLYMRRVLAAEAIEAGFEKDPLVQAQLRIARDKVLSDARLAAIELKEAPTDEAMTQFAKAAYQAKPDRFMQPAQIQARHILVKGTDAEARAKAEGLLAELKKGADFAALAKKSSDDPGSAANGGDLGFFGRGQMVKPFEDAAFALEQPGDLSPLVESTFGFHIIELTKKRPAAPQPFVEVEKQLKDEAVKQSVKDVRDAVLQRLNETLQFNKPAIEAFAAAQSK